MNIIIDPVKVDAMRQKYTVLELDTFRLIPSDQTITAWCVVENIPINELITVESKKSLHENLLINYRKKDWNYCRQALEHLLGSWGKELDSFYADLSRRVDQYSTQDPGPEWDGTVEKSVA